jgi:hypothetical protein
MSGYDLGSRVRDKFERKMQQVTRRLSELDDEELRQALEDVGNELEAVSAELEAIVTSEVAPPYGVQDRIEARRERLEAKRERLELKLELREDLRERLQTTLDDLKTQMADTLSDVESELHARTAHGFDWRRRYTPSTPATPSSHQMHEERRKILEMVQKGTISADDASQLLDALRDQEEASRRQRRRPRWVRIRVTDTLDDKVRVNLTLPVGLVRAGLRAGGSIAGVEGLDTAGLEEMLDRGELGHILDADDDHGQRIEIFVE